MSGQFQEPQFDVRPTTPMYGMLSRPTSSPRPDTAPKPTSPIIANGYEDPRHNDGTPIPWLRYFFPKDFDVREGSPENPFYQFFDVTLTPLEEDITVPPPAWSPNAYFRLSFTQKNLGLHEDVAARQPEGMSPLDAIDFTRGDWPVYAEGAEEHLKEVESFCRSVATFRARTWKDAFPLVDLLRGLLLYLLGQMGKGQQLAREYAMRDARRMIDEARARMQAEHEAALEAARAAWQQETEAKLAAAKEAMRKQVSEELSQQMKAIGDEKERWAVKSIHSEQHAKKLQEMVHQLERQVETLNQQVESDRVAHNKALSERDTEIKAAGDRVRGLEDSLLRARRAILDALKARSKQEVLAVATSGIAATLPGSHAYVAALCTQGTADAGADPTLQAAKALVSEEPEGPLAVALSKVQSGFLHSPLMADYPGGPAAAAAAAPGSSTPPADAASLVLKYVQASADHNFMVGQKLPYGTGVSWALTGAGTPGGKAAAEVLVPDVATREGVHFFRPDKAAGGLMLGAYYAVPLVGTSGEVLGMLGVDTLAAAGSGGAGGGGAGGAGGGKRGSLGSEDQEFIREMAAAVNAAIARDQQALADVVLQASLLRVDDGAAPSSGPVDLDPEGYADMPGGLRLFKEALAIMKGLTDDDLDKFRSMDKPDDATLAALRAILAAAGEVADGDWKDVRQRITRQLVDKLLKMDPHGAWAEWQALCQALRPLLEVEAEVGKLDGLMAGEEERLGTPEVTEGRGPSAGGERSSSGGGALGDAGEGLRSSAFGRALGRWLAAVRKVSAANAMKKVLEAKLAKANQALMRTFQGDGSSALTELRTYRVPPKITFQVLQAVLLLSGGSEDDCHNWGKMRILTNYKLIKRLTELKPGQAAGKLIKHCSKLTKSLDEEDVRQESMATLALFKWLQHFAKAGELLAQTSS